MPTSSDRDLGGLCYLGGFHLPYPSKLQNPEDHIFLAQQTLKRLGYSSVPTDGVLGLKTRAAMDAYKRARGLRTNVSEQRVIEILLDERAKQYEKERQAQEDRTRELFERLLDSLPGPTWSTRAKWGGIRLVVAKWLMLTTEQEEPSSGVLPLCVRALREFPIIQDRLLKQIPEREQSEYVQVRAGRTRGGHDVNIPALTMFWIRHEAKAALKDSRGRALLKELHQCGASARLLLLLSFVPTLLFAMLSFRARIRKERSNRKPLLLKYRNKRTKLSYGDPYAAMFLTLRDEGDPLVSGCTDDEIREMVARSLTSLPREREQVIWSSVGLDKIPPSGLANTRPDDFRKVPLKTASIQEIWDYIFFPLMEYLKPLAPRLKKDSPGIIPERAYEWASRLVHYRSRGLWGDRQDLLKQRYLDLRYPHR